MREMSHRSEDAVCCADGQQRFVQSKKREVISFLVFFVADICAPGTWKEEAACVGYHQRGCPKRSKSETRIKIRKEEAAIQCTRIHATVMYRLYWYTVISAPNATVNGWTRTRDLEPIPDLESRGWYGE